MGSTQPLRTVHNITAWSTQRHTKFHPRHDIGHAGWIASLFKASQFRVYLPKHVIIQGQGGIFFIYLFWGGGWDPQCHSLEYSVSQQIAPTSQHKAHGLDFITVQGITVWSTRHHSSRHKLGWTSQPLITVHGITVRGTQHHSITSPKVWKNNPRATQKCICQDVIIILCVHSNNKTTDICTFLNGPKRSNTVFSLIEPPFQ